MKKYLIILPLVLLAVSCSQQPELNFKKNQSDAQNQATSTSSDQNTGWSAYTSPAKYGFSAKYPQGWEAKDSSDTNNLNIMFINTHSRNPVETDELILSTNAKSNSNYSTLEAKTFSASEGSDSYIKFLIGSNRIYARCYYEADGQAALSVCNKILGTIIK